MEEDAAVGRERQGKAHHHLFHGTGYEQPNNLCMTYDLYINLMTEVDV